MGASAALLALLAVQQVPPPERGARSGDVEQSLRRTPEPREPVPARIREAAPPTERAGRVLVDGPGRADAAFVLAFFDGVEAPERLDLEDLERRLLLLNDVPGLRVGAILGPGAVPGETDVHLEAEEWSPVTLEAGYDNHGAENTGRHRASGRIELRDLWNEGHVFALQSIHALGARERELDFLRADYGIPVPDGSWIRAHAGTYRYEADRERTVLDPGGEGRIWGARIEHALRRTSAFSVWLSLGVESKRIVQEQLGVETARDELRVAALGVRTEWGRWSAALDLGQGIGEDDDVPSRAGAEGDFRVARLAVVRHQPLGEILSLFGRLEAQWAVEPLAASEQFALGGPDRLRGYPAFEATGDRGYAATLEARLRPPVPAGDPWTALRLAAFVDVGEAVLDRPGPGERRTRVLSAAGVGLRVDAPGLVVLRADLAFPLSEADPSDGEDWAVYAGLTLGIR